jgi:hypothetical protein
MGQNRGLIRSKPLPVYTRQPTLGRASVQVASGHIRTHAAQQILFNHLISSKEQRGRHGEAERFGSLHVDH